MVQIRNEKVAAALTISNNEFKQKLSEIIEQGEKLFNLTTLNDREFDLLESDFKIWNDYNFEFLKDFNSSL